MVHGGFPPTAWRLMSLCSRRGNNSGLVAGWIFCHGKLGVLGKLVRILWLWTENVVVEDWLPRLGATTVEAVPAKAPKSTVDTIGAHAATYLVILHKHELLLEAATGKAPTIWARAETASVTKVDALEPGRYRGGAADTTTVPERS